MRPINLAIAALLAGCADLPAGVPHVAPAEIRASAKCSEHFLHRATAIPSKEVFRASGNGYVVATYRLDGTGRAKDIRVAISVPQGAFDSAVVAALEKSEFRPGVKAEGCQSVDEFVSVKRTAP
jgi:TonB family protein